MKKIKLILYDLWYSVYFSVKDVAVDVYDFIKEFKKPKTWLYILFLGLFYSILKRDFLMFKILTPLAVVAYVVTKRSEGLYKNEMRIRAFKNNNDLVLKEEYERYKKESFFKKTIVVEYELWKQQELQKIKNNKM